MTPLQKLLREAMDATGHGPTSMNREAERHGLTLDKGTVSHILSGRTKNPSPETMAALASILPITINEIRTAAGMPLDHGEWTPPEESRALNHEQRKAVSEIIRLYAEANTHQKEPAHEDRNHWPKDYHALAALKKQGPMDRDNAGGLVD